MSDKGAILETFGKEDTKIFRYLCFKIQTSMKTRQKLTKEIINGREFSISDVMKFKKAVECLDGFTGWDKFNKNWDVFWAGLDIRYAVWVAARHNSTLREMIIPVTLIQKNRGIVMPQAKHNVVLQTIEIPKAVLDEREKMFKDPEKMRQLESDEKVSDFLTGDVSAKITKMAHKEMLEKQLAELEDDE